VNNDIQEWVTYNEEQQLITQYTLCHTGDDHSKDDNEGAEKTDRRSHSGGSKSIETALAYTKQQTRATTTEILQFGCWHDLAKKKRNEAKNQMQ
jgi:hypothetical protein